MSALLTPTETAALEEQRVDLLAQIADLESLHRSAVRQWRGTGRVLYRRKAVTYAKSLWALSLRLAGRRDGGQSGEARRDE